MREREPEDRFVRMQEAMALLGVGRTTLWNWTKQGRIVPPTRLSRKVVGWPYSVLAAVIKGGSK